MTHNDYAKLHQMGSDAAVEAAKSSQDGSAIEFIKKGPSAYRRFVAEKVVGLSELQTWIWLGGFNAKLEGTIINGLQSLERKIDALKVG